MLPARGCMMHSCYGTHDAARLVSDGLDHGRVGWSSSSLQVEDLKASVTPFVVGRAVDVSVSCTVVHLLRPRGARLKRLLA